jgi:HEAT repeat protein
MNHGSRAASLLSFLKKCPQGEGECRFMKRNQQGWDGVGRLTAKTPFSRVYRLLIFYLAATSFVYATSAQQKAWKILEAGSAEKGAIKRAEAVRALGLLPRDARAAKMAEKALSDDNSDVRAAAAAALGEMHAEGSIPKLTVALSDKDPVVVLSAAHALLAMHNHKAYDVYYAILTGQRKGGRGLVAEQRAMLDDPKKVAELGVETGLGFVPFGGIGVSAYKLVSKGGSDEVRAAAAEVLAKDPDPESRDALLQALSDRSYAVRIAALKALSTQRDPRLLTQIEPCMDDDKDVVQYTAAAVVIRLSQAGPLVRRRSEPTSEHTEFLKGDNSP